MSTSPTTAPDREAPRRRSYRYLDLITAMFVTVLLCSNLIGPGKACALDLGWRVVPDWTQGAGWHWTSLLVFGAGNLFFPISYIFDDILTEVYGYAKSRKVIWAGFGAMIFATVMAQVIIHLPLDPEEPFNKLMQPALEVCFGAGPRIIIASMIAFWAGDFANSYVLAKMKILTRGRWLWTRTIGSTIVGEGLDSLIFYPIALTSWQPLLRALGVTSPALLDFGKGWEAHTAVKIIIFNWFFKTMVEVIMTPATYAVCGWLKRAESENYFDIGTDFNPFSLKD